MMDGCSKQRARVRSEVSLGNMYMALRGVWCHDTLGTVFWVIDKIDISRVSCELLQVLGHERSDIFFRLVLYLKSCLLICAQVVLHANVRLEGSLYTRTLILSSQHASRSLWKESNHPPKAFRLTGRLTDLHPTKLHPSPSADWDSVHVPAVLVTHASPGGRVDKIKGARR